MEQHKIDRINLLARKAKERALTPVETEEQNALRKEYIAAYRRNLKAQLDVLTGRADKNSQDT